MSAATTSQAEAIVPPRRGPLEGGRAQIPSEISSFDGSSSRTENNAAAHMTNSFAMEVDSAQSANTSTTVIDDDDAGFTKSRSGSPGQSPTPLAAAQAQSQRETSSEGDLIEVNHSGYQLPLDPNSKGKLKSRYVMPDGTVVNGKGLGRGRPGMKRGPRKSALSRELTADSSNAVSTPSPTPQTRVPSGKRKRADSDVIKADDVDEDDEDDDDDAADDNFSRDSTPEYNPAASTQTRSGRQSQKPTPIITPTSTASPATKRPSLNQVKSSPSIKKHPRIKPKVYRGREQFALCEHCLRQNGPPGNAIVFCDACNKCWHQRCHNPKISKEVVADTKAEWFCSDCDRILHGKKKTKAQPTPPMQIASKPAVLAPPPIESPAPSKIAPRYSLPLIPGMSLTLAQRKQYLHSSSKEKLIEIVLQAANLAPNMPIFETPLHLIPQPQPQGFSIFIDPPQPPPTLVPSPSPSLVAQQSIPMPPPPPPIIAPVPMNSMPPPPPPSQLAPYLPKQLTTNTPSHTHPIPNPDTRPVYSHPTAHITAKPNMVPPPPSLTPEDEGYYDDYDELALVYPKAGEGVYDMAMAPESTDLGIMLEGPESKTFSHWVKGHGEAKSRVDALSKIA